MNRDKYFLSILKGLEHTEPDFWDWIKITHKQDYMALNNIENYIDEIWDNSPDTEFKNACNLMVSIWNGLIKKYREEFIKSKTIPI